MLLFASLLCLTLPAVAQSPVIGSNPPGSVTIDASRLTTIVALDSAWRFQSSDDPRFADPKYDDSAWPLIQPGMDKRLADAHIPNVPDGRSWARLHLHILNANGPLAISLASVRNDSPYAVFANGKEIGATKGFSVEAKYSATPLSIVLPQEREIVLAVHFVFFKRTVIHYFPIQRFEIGQSEALGNKVELRRRQDLDEAYPGILFALMYFAGMLLSLLLLLVQRNHREYLWLAIYFFLFGVDVASIVGWSTNVLPLWTWAQYLNIFIDNGWLEVVGLEFVAELSQTRHRGWVRIVQAYHLVFPIFYVFGYLEATWIAGFVGGLLVLILSSYMLIAAYRRGNRECGLLFFPYFVKTVMGIVNVIPGVFPTLLPPVWTENLNGKGLSAYEPAALFFMAGLISVILLRFNRVTKDEQVAASEFEAARTVQQLLIPTTAPATPGFSVESVYLPAQKVGGDFFLILPALEKEDDSLLAVVGDVSGKGLQAAMVVSTIIGGLRMQVSREPAEVLAHLNRMLAGHISGFATCCAMLIHRDGRIRIANAGNPSPYCNGEELQTLPGLPLGLVSEVAYEETEYILENGQRLTFVSDGVVEAARAETKELFGFDRTKAISGESASVIAKAASDFGAGAPQADDITVLTVAFA
jgi:hypothetical protein